MNLAAAATVVAVAAGVAVVAVVGVGVGVASRKFFVVGHFFSKIGGVILFDFSSEAAAAAADWLISVRYQTKVP